MDASVCITVAAHTSLGTMPIYLWGTDEQKRDWLPELCAGRRLAAFGLTEPEAGSDAGNTRTTARLEDGQWVDQRREAVHHQLRHRHHRLRVDHGRDRRLERPQGDLQHHRPERHARLRDRRGLPQDGLERVRHAAAHVRGLPRARGEPARPARRRLQAVPAHPRRRPHRRRRDGRRHGAGRARPGARLREGAQGVRPADLEVPGDPGQDRRHVGRDRGGAPAHLQGRDREGPRARASRSPPRRRS